MFCESRIGVDCTSDVGVVYYEELDIDLCPICWNLVRAEEGLEPVDEDEDATAEE